MTDMPWLTPPNTIVYVCATDSCPDVGIEKSVPVAQLATNLIAGPLLGFCTACGHAVPIKPAPLGDMP